MVEGEETILKKKLLKKKTTRKKMERGTVNTMSHRQLYQHYLDNNKMTGSGGKSYWE